MMGLLESFKRIIAHVPNVPRRYYHSISSIAAMGFLLVGYQNCSQSFMFIGTFDSASLSPDHTGFAAAQKVLQDSCVRCHSSSGSASFAPLNFSTESQFIAAGLVVPGEPSKSKLLFRLRNFPAGDGSIRTMPLGGSLTDAQYEALYGWVLRMGVTSGPFACNPDSPAESNLTSNHAQRLNSSQYKSTLNDLFSRFFSVSETKALIDPILASFPLPAETSQYKSWDNEFTSQHANQFFGIADALANQIVSNSTLYNEYINGVIALQPGACTSVNPASLSLECQKQFIRNLGLRVYRRPLIEQSTDDEVESLRAEFANASSTSEAVSSLTFRMLMSPQFLMKLEVNEQPGPRPDILVLSSFALASRLSYSFWNSMPDEKLFELANTTNLQDPTAFQNAVNYVFNSPRISDGLRRFVTDWLKLEKLPDLNSSGVNASYFNYGANIDANTRLEMIDEIGELAGFVATNNLSFKDLFTTDVSFARSPTMMKIYGMSQPAPTDDSLATALHLPAGTRSGLLTRAALQVGRIGDGTANPVLRGLMVRRDILCLEMNPPPPTLQGALMLPPIDSSMTIRERFHQATSPSTCNACHQLINPLGFGLSNYNGFGFYQALEPAFNPDGTYANKTFPVDATTDMSAILGPGTTAENPVQFSSVIASQPNARRCFSEAFAKATLGRDLVRDKDGCRLNRLYNAANEGVPLREFLKSLALDPEFKLRKTSAETSP